MFSVRRRGLCAIAALVTGATLAGGLAAPAAMASTGPKAAPGTDSTITIRASGVRTVEHGGLDLTKTARPRTYTHAGEQVTYTYTVTNTKHFTLHDVHVTDDHVNGPISCTPSRIATGQMATCTATYTITGADVRRGHVTNTASAIGKAPNDQYVSSRPADATVRAKKQKAAIGLVKSADPLAADAGLAEEEIGDDADDRQAHDRRDPGHPRSRRPVRPSDRAQHGQQADNEPADRDDRPDQVIGRPAHHGSSRSLTLGGRCDERTA